MLEYENQLNLSKHGTINFRFPRLSGNNMLCHVVTVSQRVKRIKLNEFE